MLWYSKITLQHTLLYIFGESEFINVLFLSAGFTFTFSEYSQIIAYHISVFKCSSWCLMSEI